MGDVVVAISPQSLKSTKLGSITLLCYMSNNPGISLKTHSQPFAKHCFCLFFFHIWVYSDQDNDFRLSPFSLSLAGAPGPSRLHLICRFAQNLHIFKYKMVSVTSQEMCLLLTVCGFSINVFVYIQFVQFVAVMFIIYSSQLEQIIC